MTRPSSAWRNPFAGDNATLARVRPPPSALQLSPWRSALAFAGDWACIAASRVWAWASLPTISPRIFKCLKALATGWVLSTVRSRVGAILDSSATLAAERPPATITSGLRPLTTS